MTEESNAQDETITLNLTHHLLWVCASKITYAKRKLRVDGLYPSEFKSEFDVQDRFLLCEDILKSLGFMKALMQVDVTAMLDESEQTDSEDVVEPVESKPE
jgi:hypothetical protein